MRADSIGIFNNDDEQCRRIIAAFKGYAATFGIDREADLTASEYRMDGLEGSSFEMLHKHNGGERRWSRAWRLQYRSVVRSVDLRR